MKTKQQKRQEAARRALEYNNLSLEEKLAKISRAPGESTKQLSRLYKSQA